MPPIASDIHTYHIHVAGPVDEGELNAHSPLEMRAEWVDLAATRLTVLTDQSGLIGLMRHLHGLGFAFLAMSRVDTGGTPGYPGERKE